LEEERRYLQNSQKWLVEENKKLQQCCNYQELLLWDRRQAFLCTPGRSRNIAE